MTLRLVLLICACFGVLLTAEVASGRQEGPPVSKTLIRGGGLAEPVLLAAVDEDSFRRRINRPPQLDEKPENVTGPSYTVESPYWDEVIRNHNGGNGSDDEDNSNEPVDLAAEYFPEKAYVRATQAGEDVWLVLNHRQRAILDRYIRLAEAGLIGPRPGPLEVLTAASRDELITLEIGSRHLNQQETAAFWEVARGLSSVSTPNTEGWQPPQGGPDSVWLIFSLPQGRTVQMLYSLSAGTLVDHLGASVYEVAPDWLDPVLGDEAPRPGNIPFQQTEIEQEESPGSQVWWLIMVGGGLAAIGAAVYLQRRWS